MSAAATEYWVPDDREGYKVVPSTSLSDQQRKAPKAFPIRIQNEKTSWRDDLVKLDDVNEATILQNLRLRFAENLMYTSLGTIIVSINPYFRIPGLYDDDVAREYRGGSFELEPHVFQVAERAYSGLLDSRNNQAIIISGESGAGKTEATKQCLKFIAVNAGSSSSGVQDRILAANPLLEAFGNAKTLRNDNSSRFGKWMTNGFDANGIICSCKNINYLLETSRVVTHQEGERNFHIFYMLIAGASTDLQASLHLDGRGSDDFQFTNQSSVTQLPGKTEVDMFREVQMIKRHPKPCAMSLRSWRLAQTRWKTRS